MKSNNCLIITGEKSGEEHCLSFFSDLKKRCPEISFWGVGGDDLLAEGMELIYHINDFSSMGFSEIIKKIPFYSKALDNIEQQAIKRKCTVAILVDYPGFNLRLSKRLKKLNIKIIYYVAPQVWAWKSKRVEIIKENVNTLFTILPFEKDWFAKKGFANVVSTRHPLLNTYQNQLSKVKPKNNKQINIVLLPGSRKSEIMELLPTYILAVKQLKQKHDDLTISIVISRSLDEKIFNPYLSEIDSVFHDDNLGEVLLNSDLAIATSGTVTLAAALFRVPTIVCYTSSLFTQFIFNSFVKYSGYISLANLVARKRIFNELIADRVTEYNICIEFDKIISDKVYANNIQIGLNEMYNSFDSINCNIAEKLCEIISDTNDTNDS
ncbi:MAG: lipid-A-disaccharide synthase [Bdellovibrionales bacterium]|nr:lipid-A-disaccharide synthase [Bdellovibrionales bacterium]